MGGFSVFTTVRTKPDVITYDIETHLTINISENRATAMYNES